MLEIYICKLINSRVMIFIVCLGLSTQAINSKNDRPVIGILTQAIREAWKDDFPNKSTLLSASYVKFIESAGARVVPIHVGKNAEYYEMMFNKTNGLLLPGGNVTIEDSRE